MSNKVRNVPYKTSEAIRSGRVAASSTEHGPPSDWPKSTARSEPAASRTAVMSAPRSSSVGRCGIGSERPVPGLSYMISRVKEARRSRNLEKRGSVHCRSRCEMKPGARSMSTGPSPTTW